MKEPTSAEVVKGIISLKHKKNEIQLKCLHRWNNYYMKCKSMQVKLCWLVWLIEFFPELDLNNFKHWGRDKWLRWPNGHLWALGASREGLLWAEQGRRSTRARLGGGGRSREGRGEVRETRGTLRSIASDSRRGRGSRGEGLFLGAKEWRWPWCISTTLHFFLFRFYPDLLLALKKLLAMWGTLHAPPLQLLCTYKYNQYTIF